MQPKIVRRNEWGARPAKSRLYHASSHDIGHQTTGRMLGHVDYAQWVRNIQAFHMGPSRGWSDIGYNWLVAPDGVIYEGRGDGVVGAQCQGHNTGYRGIAFLGNGDEITPAAKKSIAWLVGDNPITPHRDLGQTDCPGDTMAKWIHAGCPVPKGVVPQPSAHHQKAPAALKHPAWGGRYLKLQRPAMRGEDVLTWQKQMRRRGWNIDDTGVFDRQSDTVLRAFQKEKRAAGYKVDGRLIVADGVLGAISWLAAWDAKVTK